MECDGEYVDGKCGCRRSFSGMDSLKATTTARILNLPITEEQYLEAYQNAMNKAGWDKLMQLADIKDEVKYLLQLASNFDEGTIIEKRGPKIVERLI